MNRRNNEEEELSFGEKVFWFVLGLVLISIIYPVVSPFMTTF